MVRLNREQDKKFIESPPSPEGIAMGNMRALAVAFPAASEQGIKNTNEALRSKPQRNRKLKLQLISLKMLVPLEKKEVSYEKYG